MAYNNGIVIVADELRLGKPGDGSAGIARLKGPSNRQRRPDHRVDLLRQEEVSRHGSQPSTGARQDHRHARQDLAGWSPTSPASPTARTQRQSDLSANKPFHVEIEKLSRSVYCPTVSANGSTSAPLAATTRCSPRRHHTGQAQSFDPRPSPRRAASPRPTWPNTSTPGTESPTSSALAPRTSTTSWRA